MEIGIYYYPWYNKTKWHEHKIKYTPEIGFYDSSDPVLIDYHISILKNIAIDFIIIELLPIKDWNFKFSYNSTKLFVKKLKDNNIKFTYLIDTACGLGHIDSCKNINMLFEMLRNDGLYPTKYYNDKPMLLFFSTTVPEALNIKTRYSHEMSIYFPIFLDDWTRNDTINNAFLIKKNFDVNIATPRKDMLSKLNFFQFWAPTSVQVELNKFCSVIAGYDDLLLNRSPQLAPLVERNSGKTMVAQMRNAVEYNSELIMIYGFNEFFEATNIEPTLEYGDFYVELTKHLVKQAHTGEAITFPEGLKQHKGKIIYLTPEIEHGAQRHEDKIPRWDGDYWVAEILSLDEPKVIGNQIVIENVKVKNSGIRTWAIETEKAPIFLGVKLLDAEKNVLSEGRASIGGDIPPGEKFVQTINVEFTENAHAEFVEIGIVWENEFWLESSKSLKIYQLL